MGLSPSDIKPSINVAKSSANAFAAHCSKRRRYETPLTAFWPGRPARANAEGDLGWRRCTYPRPGGFSCQNGKGDGPRFSGHVSRYEAHRDLDFRADQPAEQRVGR